MLLHTKTSCSSKSLQIDEKIRKQIFTRPPTYVGSVKICISKDQNICSKNKRIKI